MRYLLFIGLIFFVFCINGFCQNDSISDETILKFYKTLRVADVSDGMDMVGLRDVGLEDRKLSHYGGILKILVIFFEA